ncbi:MAG TPA: siroheme synthase CysG [Vicinamibacterales bacterium]|jgi:uroporphyrin-III C-methyltransferase/precorrin-2 dehydrogenase/sirohydrochlorin ferrochelatase
MALFPMFFKLAGRSCLVVGAGSVGEAKTASLLEAGANVRVVSPSATPLVKEWAAVGRITWSQKSFEPHDLDGMVLVIAAVPAGDLTKKVHAEARQRGVLCNAVDDPERCDFYYPAVVTRGDFQIAVSTGGRSPALAQRIRRELEEQFGPDYEGWVQELGVRREALFAQSMDPEERKRRLHAAASREAFVAYRLASRGSALGSGSDPGKPKAESLKPGTVHLVGAGPGDPELLTLKALRLLGTADVVLHDDLVSHDVLELVSPNALILNVGKRHHDPHISQEGINTLLVEHAREGRTVVRLKGGDVAVFGRANEEVDALRAAGIGFEIVPGVTAMSGAAAAAGISLTDRRTTSAVVLVTAQTCKGNARPNWRAIADTGATMAVYMPGDRYELIANELLAAGLDSGTPCRIVSRASQSDESVVTTTIGGLASQERLPAPAVLIVGDVGSQKSEVGRQKTEVRSQETEDKRQDAIQNRTRSF